MSVLLTGLDLAAIATSLLAAYLWYRAGVRSVRRVSRHEELNWADLNRMVVAMNRTAILNRRAALASAAAAFCFALEFAATMVAGIETP